VDYKISASILNADFLQLRTEVDAIVEHVDELHLDVMDGMFVDNISFGPPVLAGLREAYPAAVLDTHLMITTPHTYWEAFQEIGSDIITIHYEATHHSYILLKELRDAGLQAGISITPATDVRLLEPIAAYIDRILIMTVEPGFGGQSMIPEMLTKVELTRQLFGDGVDIQVDGGINEKTIRSAKDAGANVFVVGSYIFKSYDREARVGELRDRLGI
jgi:ribulose-phosphate 3-epimerase